MRLFRNIRSLRSRKPKSIIPDDYQDTPKVFGSFGFILWSLFSLGIELTEIRYRRAKKFNDPVFGIEFEGRYVWKIVFKKDGMFEILKGQSLMPFPTLDLAVKTILQNDPVLYDQVVRRWSDKVDFKLALACKRYFDFS